MTDDTPLWNLQTSEPVIGKLHHWSIAPCNSLNADPGDTPTHMISLVDTADFMFASELTTPELTRFVASLEHYLDRLEEPA